MKKRGIVIILLISLVLVLSFFVLPKTGFVVSQDEGADKNYLDNLKAMTQVECLQNSQCSEGFECVANKCVDKEEINNCQTRDLSLPNIKLEDGRPINITMQTITRRDLPYLLAKGKIAEIKEKEEKLTEYFYVQTISIGNNLIEKENSNYFIKNHENSPLYTYKIYFSNGVDFSDKDIQGQVLRILGKEYVISEKSTNSKIELISDKANIVLEDGKNSKIIKDKGGNALVIEIEYYFSQDLNVKESYDNLFDSIKLSSDSINKENYVNLIIGGNC